VECAIGIVYGAAGYDSSFNLFRHVVSVVKEEPTYTNYFTRSKQHFPIVIFCTLRHVSTADSK